MVESNRDVSVTKAQKRRAPVRKWTAKEDETLRNGVLSYLTRNQTPKFSEICKKLPQRSVKQAKERWKNSLNPEITKGQWTTQEIIQLLDLIVEKGENWTEIQQVLSHRSMHCIKSKGRKLLGESISKKLKRICKGMLIKSWTDEEREKLRELHMKFKYDMESICLHLGTGKSIAQAHRELITTCNCSSCIQKVQDLKAMNMDFKLAWAVARAMELRNQLADSSLKSDENIKCASISPATHVAPQICALDETFKENLETNSCKVNSPSNTTSASPSPIFIKPMPDVYSDVMKDAEMAKQRFSQRKREREQDLSYDADIMKKLKPLGWNDFDTEKDILDEELDFSDEDVLDDLLLSFDNEIGFTNTEVTTDKASRRPSVVNAWNCLGNQCISVN